MPIQFAGSSSTGDRRRRRLAVNGDGSDVDPSLLDGDAGEFESELVASAAAAPWVPVSEFRIWIYASIMGLLLAGLAFVLARPVPFRAALTPLADHLLGGSRPLLVVVVQTAFLALSTQLGMLISWYRSRCKLDFAGRYRVWPWAVGLFSLAAFCEATNVHNIFGQLIAKSALLSWRGETVAWLLPFCLAGLPIAILLDRDVRNNRSSLLTLRFSGLLWLTAVCLEVYQIEFSSFAWFGLVRQLVPLFASSTLFLGLWLHARIVAYVCPDPPDLEERSAGSVVFSAVVWLVGCLPVWRRIQSPAEEEEEEVKPKRRRKKAEETAISEETVPVKRKRKAPAKKTTTTRTRSRIKPVAIEETEESDESTDESAYEESESNSKYAEDSSAESMEETPTVDESAEEQEQDSEDQFEQESWEEVPAEPVNPRASASKSKDNGRFTQVHQPQQFKIPAPHINRSQPAWQQEPAEQSTNQYEGSNEETDEDRQFQLDSGMSSDQMKGLSKRQKRELKKQHRDQQRLINARDREL